MDDSLRRCVAEAIGTFCLVFAGTAAIVVDAAGGGVTHVGVSMVFGLVVFAMIAAVPANTRQKVPIASATHRRSESSILQAPGVTRTSLTSVARLH